MNISFDSQFLFDSLVFLLPYLPVTIGLAVGAMFGGIILGLGSALSQQYALPFLSPLGKVYVLVCRSIPNMVLLYLIYFALPLALLHIEEQWNIVIPFRNISAYALAVLALTLHSGAYLSEIFRAALDSVDKGQTEAAEAVGMSWWQSFSLVIVPQAIVYALPLMGNQFLGLLKSTSLVFSITVVELFGAGQVLSAESYRYTEIYLLTAGIYWLLSISFEALFATLEKHSNFLIRKSHDTA